MNDRGHGGRKKVNGEFKIKINKYSNVYYYYYVPSALLLLKS